ncbi:hypothetical protein ACFL28_00690 [Candidatus Omnitrophota bacterium]
MIDNLFLIRDKKEYGITTQLTETRKLDSFSMLSWSEKEPYITNTFSHLKNVRRWEDFQVGDMSLNCYWLNYYEQIKDIALKNMEKYHWNEISMSPHFMFGLVWKLGDSYYKYIDALNNFFNSHRPEAIFFRPQKDFFSTLVLSLVKLYGVKYKRLEI